MKNPVFSLAAALAFVQAALAAPRLVVSTPSLAPESTIDLVLEAPAIATGDLGQTVPNDWLAISPELPGKLIWKAPEIARFVPDGPPLLGTKYTFSITEGRHYLDGSAVPTGKFATAESEAFRVLATYAPKRYSSNESLSTISWIVAFSDVIDPAAAPNFLTFVSKSGQRVGGKAERATVETASYYARSYKPWAARFPGAEDGEIPADAAPETPVPNVMIVTPAKPLPPGEDWQFVVLKNLPNAAATARTVVDASYSIGKIEPFKVIDIRPSVSPDSPREIVFDFNAPIPEFLPVDFLTKCIEITPRPANLAATFENRTIVLTGDFNAADRYHVRFSGPFPSRAGLDLAEPLGKPIVFERLAASLELPSGNEAQLAVGSRTYKIRTVNMASVHIRVKRLSGDNLVRAYQGYQTYSGVGHDFESIQPTAPLPWSLVPGETVYDKEITLGNDLDTSREIELRWDEILPANPGAAAVFLDVTGKSKPRVKPAGRREVQALIQLTDIGLAWKLSGEEALIYAFSCSTGKPLPGVEMEVFGEDAAPLKTLATNEAGLVTVPRPKDARHLRASLGEDAYLTAFDTSLDTVGLWHFPVRYSWSGAAANQRRAFLFTDRSVYRPGETVRLKGIVRNQEGNAVKMDEPAKAQIVIRDPTDKTIHTSPAAISASGSFDLTYKLPLEKTGQYTIRLEFPDDLAKAAKMKNDWRGQDALERSGQFEIPLQVEDFRRNAFEIAQEIAAPAMGAAKISANLAATYYQGQPVAAGTVKYFSRVSAENFYPERFRDYLFGNHRTADWAYWYHYFGYRWDDGSQYRQTNQQEGTATLDADGKASLAVEIPQADFPTARNVAISSEVTDANNQTLTSTSEATVHPASVYAGISRIDRLVRAGEAVPLEIVAAGTDGEPFPGALRVTATLTREVNSTVKSRNDAGDTVTRNDAREETVSTAEIAIDPKAFASGGTPFSVTPRATGQHFLTVRGTDPDGHAFATVTSFKVYGTDEYPWLYEDGMRVKLVAEKKSYKPGETARVLVLSPIEGTALVTVEREKVLRSFQVELKADNPVVEIPLGEEDAPNAFVSVLIVKGSQESARERKEPQLRLGYCELIVEPVRDALAVTMKTDFPDYRPADEVKLAGTVTLAGGAPAAGAEVTFYAEDEGTLAVMGYETPRPMDYFYSPRNLDVNAGTSFSTFLSEDPDERSFWNKGFFIGGGGDLSALRDLLRKNFDPCAAWAPALVTDSEGRFSHTFRVPDTLTRYRLIAIAHHGGAKFGHGESSIVVKKDLMLEPKAPRFANQGDHFDTRVLVQNASQFNGTWEIAFSTGGGEGTPSAVPDGPVTQTVTIASGKSASLVFPTRAETTGEAVLTWRATPVSLENQELTVALRTKLSDSVENRFNVEYPMPLIRQSVLIRLEKDGSRVALRKLLDQKLLDGTGDISLEFSRSPLIEAAGSIDYLLHYPYGCVEQTTSSLIPWLAVDSLAPVVPRFAEMSKDSVAGAIQAGADRLLSMQLPDGSFAYWPGGTQPVPWATSYGGLGLILAAQKGASVPPSALESLTKSLIAGLRGISSQNSSYELEIQTRALLVLAIAGKPQASYQNLLADRLADLTSDARSLLAAAIALGDPGNPANLAAARAVLESTVPFRGDNGNWMPWRPDDAYRLIAWLAVDPSGEQPTQSLEKMFRARNPYGHWRTTWVNGWSLLALARYADAHSVNGPVTSFGLEAGGKTETISLDAGTPAAARSFLLAPGLDLALTADREAFVRVNLASKPQIAPIQPVSTDGLSIERTYERVLGNGSVEVLTEPKVGDLIRVSLRVTLPQDDSRYLVIEDPLPSLFETVNQNFESQRSAAGVHTSENDWNISHSELRTDRAVFFLDRVWRAGTHTITYLARCTVAGQATAPPAKVESMYDPEKFALSASRNFKAE